jgi:phosphopantetheinyl transferase
MRTNDPKDTGFWLLPGRIALWDFRWPAEDNGPIELLAEKRLGDLEQDDWKHLRERALPRRKRDWLGGRLASKQALAAWRRHRGQPPLAPRDCQVLADHLGAPRLHLPTGSRPPRISIAHSGDRVLIALSEDEIRVGVDNEPAGRLRMPVEQFADAILAPSEITVVTATKGPLDHTLLKLWCAKEAAAKALGTGLQGRPKAFHVTRLDTNPGEVQTPGGSFRLFFLPWPTDWIGVVAYG